jgi:hypothetical protein
MRHRSAIGDRIRVAAQLLSGSPRDEVCAACRAAKRRKAPG